MTRPILGIIADDLTGATDLGSALAKGGMRTVQFTGVPEVTPDLSDIDAVIIGLKTRSINPDRAVALSVAALNWLQSFGIGRFVFKYCSTFDSTDRGNIGPVAEALMDALGIRQTIFCPAFPENGRTVYAGHLFVGDRLLSESGMRDHPVTPMRDPDLRRVLAKQVTGNVGLLHHSTVVRGPEAIMARLTELNESGTGLVIVDALYPADLTAIAEACCEFPLITGGSGIALPLPELLRNQGVLPPAESMMLGSPGAGPSAILSGSCSVATLKQIDRFRPYGDILELDLSRLPDDNLAVEAISWAKDRLGQPFLIAASQPPHQVQALQERLGAERSAEAVEGLMAAIAVGLVDMGVTRMIVAGGETSGAVVNALSINGLCIGAEIAPGVPWTFSLEPPHMALALKSGNFGGPDFFACALGLTQ